MIIGEGAICNESGVLNLPLSKVLSFEFANFILHGVLASIILVGVIDLFWNDACDDLSSISS